MLVKTVPHFYVTVYHSRQWYERVNLTVLQRHILWLRPPSSCRLTLVLVWTLIGAHLLLLLLLLVSTGTHRSVCHVWQSDDNWCCGESFEIRLYCNITITFDTSHFLSLILACICIRTWDVYKLQFNFFFTSETIFIAILSKYMKCSLCMCLCVCLFVCVIVGSLLSCVTL